MSKKRYKSSEKCSRTKFVAKPTKNITKGSLLRPSMVLCDLLWSCATYCGLDGLFMVFIVFLWSFLTI